jgi:hypothetical protein
MTDEQIIPVINGRATSSAASVSIITTLDYCFGLASVVLVAADDLASITTTSFVLALFTF